MQPEGGAPLPAPATLPPQPVSSDLQSLADSIAHATTIIQAASLGEGAPPSPAFDPAYCSLALPAPQPLAPIETTVGERLFLVCTPAPPPSTPSRTSYPGSAG